MSRFLLRIPTYFFRKKKKVKIKKIVLLNKRPNLINGINSIKKHNDKYKGEPLHISLLNRGCSFSKNLAKRFIPRLEAYKDISFFGTNTIQGKAISNIISNLRHKKYTSRFNKLANIFILDLTLSYKGWRHMRRLPVRGQRTRSNANTSKKGNLDLRTFKAKVMKKFYGSVPSELVNSGMLVESYNLLWFNQWKKEWKDNKKRRLKFSKSSNKVCVYDFASTAAGRIVGYYRKPKAGKKKRVHKDNSFTIGLRKGETKRLLLGSIKKGVGSVFSLPNGSIAQLIVSSIKEKKKVTKKISSAKKKQDKLAKVKKKKELAKNKFSELKRIRDQKTKNLKKAQK